MATTRKVSLSKQADWETWLSFIQTKATRSGIWDLINPSLATKAAEFPEPVKPSPPLPEPGQQVDKNAVETYKLLTADYKLDLDEYDRQQRALTEITNFIHETVSVQTATFIKKADTHPWSQLRALKARLAPTDSARSVEVINKHHRLVEEVIHTINDLRFSKPCDRPSTHVYSTLPIHTYEAYELKGWLWV